MINYIEMKDFTTSPQATIKVVTFLRRELSRTFMSSCEGGEQYLHRVGVFGCVMCFLMCQCVQMPRSVSGNDVWSVICVMLGFAGVWKVALLHSRLKL